MTIVTAKTMLSVQVNIVRLPYCRIILKHLVRFNSELNIFIGLSKGEIIDVNGVVATEIVNKSLRTCNTHMSDEWENQRNERQWCPNNAEGVSVICYV